MFLVLSVKNLFKGGKVLDNYSHQCISEKVIGESYCISSKQHHECQSSKTKSHLKIWCNIWLHWKCHVITASCSRSRGRKEADEVKPWCSLYQSWESWWSLEPWTSHQKNSRRHQCEARLKFIIKYLKYRFTHGE